MTSTTTPTTVCDARATNETLVTRVDLDDLLTELTLDSAAPVELAAAAFGDRLSRGRVAAAAAHQVATVGARRQPVAAPSARARRAGLRVRGAEVARALDEHQVVAGGPVEGAVALDQPRALSVERHLRGGVVAVSQPVAGLAERRQLVPARPNAARSRHAVALAAYLGVPVHRLHTNTPASSSSSSSS